jgi:hypothetical protein
MSVNWKMRGTAGIFKRRILTVGFLNIFSMYVTQHCFICRPLDSTVPEDAWIEPGVVATLTRESDAFTTRLYLISFSSMWTNRVLHMCGNLHVFVLYVMYLHSQSLSKVCGIFGGISLRC